MAKARNIEKSRSVTRRMFLGERGITPWEQQRLQNIENYLKVFCGYDPKTLDPERAGLEDSLLFAKQFGRTNSVIFEPSIEEKGRFHEELEAVRLIDLEQICKFVHISFGYAPYGAMLPLAVTGLTL